MQNIKNHKENGNCPETEASGQAYSKMRPGDCHLKRPGVNVLDRYQFILENMAISVKEGVSMDFEKLTETVDSTEVVEELIILSQKVFSKSSDDVKKVIEKFITKSYLMGKKNMVKTVD
jgi:hypothetical protein